jgi:His/Glu/Gln/Arg/opine family amino acid ABC transporter permease subunit
MDPVFMAQVLVRLLPPLGLTMLLSVTALAIATPLGLALGAWRAELPDRHPAARLIDAWVFFVRGTPILIQIFAIYFILPKLGMQPPLFIMGVGALVLNSAGYHIEIGRAAVQSLPKGQWEAALALGFDRRASLRQFILPQAARRMVGPVMNELSQLIKASSVLSVITLFELHKAAEAISSANLRFSEVIVVEGFLYFLFIFSISLIAKAVERKLSAAGGLADAGSFAR